MVPSSFGAPPLIVNVAEPSPFCVNRLSRGPDETGELRGVVIRRRRQRTQVCSREEINIARRDRDRLVLACRVDHQPGIHIERENAAQRAANRDRDVDVGGDAVAVDHQRAERVHFEDLAALGGADVGAEFEARGDKGLQSGRVDFEEEDAVEPEHVFQFDLAAELDLDQELVEVEDGGSVGVPGVDFETEIEAAVLVRVGGLKGGHVRGLEVR